MAMTNNSINWKMAVQKLQGASTGADVRKYLYDAIKLCHEIHMSNVLGIEAAYATIIEWPGGENLPIDWHIDEDGYYYYEEEQENAGS
jgi:hypothetical protein